MAPLQFKLVKEDPYLVTRSVTYNRQPTWTELALRIEKLFGISMWDVGMSYIDRDGDKITATTNEELQDCIENLTLHGTIKITVFDITSLRLRVRATLGPDYPMPARRYDDEDCRARSRSVSPIVQPEFSPLCSPNRVSKFPPVMSTRSPYPVHPYITQRGTIVIPESPRPCSHPSRSPSRESAPIIVRSMPDAYSRRRFSSPIPHESAAYFGAAKREHRSRSRSSWSCRQRIGSSRGRSNSCSRSPTPSRWPSPIIFRQYSPHSRRSRPSMPDRPERSRSRLRYRSRNRVTVLNSFAPRQERYLDGNFRSMPRSRNQISEPHSPIPHSVYDRIVVPDNDRVHCCFPGRERRDSLSPPLAPPAVSTTNDDIMKELKALKEFITVEMANMRVMHARSCQPGVIVVPPFQHTQSPESAPTPMEDVVKDIKDSFTREMSTRLTQALSSLRVEMAGIIKESLQTMSETLHSDIKDGMETKDLIGYLNAARAEVTREVAAIREERQQRNSRETSLGGEQTEKQDEHGRKEQVSEIMSGSLSLSAHQEDDDGILHGLPQPPFPDKRDYNASQAIVSPRPSVPSHPYSQFISGNYTAMAQQFPDVPSVDEPSLSMPANSCVWRPPRRRLSPYFRRHEPCHAHHRLPRLSIPSRPLPPPPPPHQSQPTCSPALSTSYYRWPTPPPLLNAPVHPLFSTSTNAVNGGNLKSENINNSLGLRIAGRCAPHPPRTEGNLSNVKQSSRRQQARRGANYDAPIQLNLPPAGTFCKSYNAYNNGSIFKRNKIDNGDNLSHSVSFTQCLESLDNISNDAASTHAQVGSLQASVHMLPPAASFYRAPLNNNNFRENANGTTNNDSNRPSFTSVPLSQRLPHCRTALEDAKRVHKERKEVFKVREEWRKERGKAKEGETILAEDVFFGNTSGPASASLNAQTE